MFLNTWSKLNLLSFFKVIFGWASEVEALFWEADCVFYALRFVLDGWFLGGGIYGIPDGIDFDGCLFWGMGICGLLAGIGICGIFFGMGM